MVKLIDLKELAQIHFNKSEKVSEVYDILCQKVSKTTLYEWKKISKLDLLEINSVEEKGLHLFHMLDH